MKKQSDELSNAEKLQLESSIQNRDKRTIFSNRWYVYYINAILNYLTEISCQIMDSENHFCS